MYMEWCCLKCYDTATGTSQVCLGFTASTLCVRDLDSKFRLLLDMEMAHEFERNLRLNFFLMLRIAANLSSSH